MRKDFLPFSPPSIGEEEIAEVVDTLRSDWITTGPKVGRFEQDFAAYVGAQEALALSSCTAALHVALATLGIGPGDAVITTTLTFCSTVHVIVQAGAQPVLVDVDPVTLNMDPQKVEEAVKRIKTTTALRLKAIIPVHLYGHPCDMDALLKIAAQHDLAIIEDAAHALPAKYKGRFIGQMDAASPVPVLTCFSFYATKNLATAEGGMLTGNKTLIDDARVWSLHGMSRDSWKRYGSGGSWFYDVLRPGFKYNMTDIQAALGIHQLRKLKGFHARRRQIIAKYTECFAAFEEFQVPPEQPEVQHAWHLYVLRLTSHSKLARDEFIQALSALKIGTSVHFIPVHMHAYYRDRFGYRPDDFPVALSEYKRMLSLPLSPRMTEQDVADVLEAVREVAIRMTATVTIG